MLNILSDLNKIVMIILFDFNKILMEKSVVQNA